VSGELAHPGALELIERIDSHAVHGWPAPVVERTDDGWTFRAAGGIGGWRLNHALTPCRELTAEEISAGLERSAEFAQRQGIHHGLQVSPLHMHDGLLSALTARGWGMTEDILVLTGSVAAIAPARAELPAPGLVVSPDPDEAWLAAWERCDPERDVSAQRRTTLPLLAGRAFFCRLDDRAVGVAVASEGLVGLFSLAVAPDTRRQGLGKVLVRAMLGAIEAETVYLQVGGENVAGLALYESLGFAEAFRYRHCAEPGVNLYR
jgi:N-acetylglutamate synthase